MLYELLTAGPPLEGATRTSYVEALQRIRSEEVPAPSRRLGKRLDPELDWVTMRVLEKDRTRRYETVNGLARDLQRYLEGEPVEAAPPSAAYPMGKFVGKNQWGLATAAALIVLLLGGVAVSPWMAVRARRAEAEARAVNDFCKTICWLRRALGSKFVRIPSQTRISRFGLRSVGPQRTLRNVSARNLWSRLRSAKRSGMLICALACFRKLRAIYNGP